jgi:hypothetical protein
MEYKLRKGKTIRHFITSLLLIIPFFPIVLLDILAEIYHRLGFRLCGIELVKRSSYVRIDGHRLKYLSLSNKIGCAYCGYANGIVSYWREIAARTERYWCAIKHQNVEGFIPQEHQKDFLEYGDEKAYRNKYEKKTGKKII